ncbi:MAG: glycoside hydrolase family 32 protein [Planctomycetota bacterium]|jgi:beta-fructofuranosidase
MNDDYQTKQAAGTARYGWKKGLLVAVTAAVLLPTRPCSMAQAEENIQEMTRSTRALREKLLKDPYRPGYHFVTLEGRCSPFDVNGAIFWKGRYHLFYIFQNEKGHCWGHISSTDLVHWRHHRTPLAPEPGDPDRGMFSGCALANKQGVPTIVYHGVKAGMCIATSTDDDLETWTKSPHNPVIPETKPGDAGYDVYNVFDPVAWIHDGHYYAALGNLQFLRKFGKNMKPEDKGDTLYLFRSDDLTHWTYLHPFYKSDRKWTREFEDNACPEFFKLGNKWMVLFISHKLGCQYYIGRYENEHFYPETHGRMSWVDNAFFAPESLTDDKGREIMWAWIFDGRKGETRKASGWSGTFSLPRVLALGEDNTLRMWPPEELEVLRYNPKKWKFLTIQADSELPLKEIRGNSLELSIEMAPLGAEQFGVRVCASPDGQEQTVVFYDADEKRLGIDTQKSSLGEGPKSVEAGPLELKPGEPLKLRVFVDKSVVEVFANNRQAVMRRIYPTRRDSLGVVLFSKGGPAKVPTLEAWDMMPSNPY